MTRFARIDLGMPEPRPVLGWYDTDEVKYPEDSLPPERERIPVLDDKLWDSRFNASFGVRDGRVFRSDVPVGQLMEQVREIAKAELLQRIIAAHRLRAFRAALRLDEHADELDDETLELRERWLANAAFPVDHVPLRRTLAAAGCEPDEILAP